MDYKNSRGPTAPMNKVLLTCALTLLAISLHAGTTVLWDASVNGTLDSFPYAPSNTTFVIHSVGSAIDDVNIVRSSVQLIPTGGAYLGNPDAFTFSVPSGLQLTGLVMTESSDYPGYPAGAFCDTATGAYDGSGDLGYWFADNPTGTNDLFATLGLSPMPAGPFSIVIYAWLIDGNTLTNTGTVNYSLNILTVPVPVLNISQAANQIMLAWTTNNSANFTLQSTTSLVPPINWVAVTNTPVIVGSQFVVTNAEASSGQLFRLVANL